MEGKTQLTKFTFYDLYAELMDTLTDEERGKLLRAMCAYAFEDAAFRSDVLVTAAGTAITRRACQRSCHGPVHSPQGC